jgi:hypothetical protein
MSWKAEIAGWVPDVWGGDRRRFPSEAEAWAYAEEQAIRYSAVEDWRVVESDDAPNFRYVGRGELAGIH